MVVILEPGKLYKSQSVIIRVDRIMDGNSFS